MQPSRKKLQDARRVTRYHVSAPVIFTWRDGDLEVKGEGVTRDISGCSTFIWSLNTLPVGTALHCEVFLPRVGFSGPSLKIVIEGRINRVDPKPRQHHVSGFAVVNERVSITAAEEVEYDYSGNNNS